MKQHIFNSDNQPFKRTIRELIRHNNHKNILDVGAGDFTEYYGFKADNIHVRYTGVDIDCHAINKASSIGIDAHCCSCESLPFEDNVFDCVICHDTINYLPDFRKTISQLTRVAKRDVYIIFHKIFCDDSRYQPDDQEIFVCKNGNISVTYKQIKPNKIVNIHYFNRVEIEHYLQMLCLDYMLISSRREWLVDHRGEERYLLHIKK